MSDRVLVTGATGLIGRYVVMQLLARGIRVRVLVRSPQRLPPGIEPRVEVQRGDIRCREALARAVQGVRTVLHLAGCARAWCRDTTEFTSVNVHAVQHLLECAHEAGVARIVHVSTVLTLIARVNYPYRRAHTWTPYEETKLIGERLVESYASLGGDAVMVHPTRVYGPGPLHDGNGVTRLVALYLRGPLVCRLADGDVLANYVHAADVAAGILLAAERGRPGARYILGGENSSLRELLSLVGELANHKRVVLAVPRVAALALAHAAEFWGRVGGAVPITPGWVRTYLEDHRVDVTPTCRELGYSPRSLREGLTETIQWLRYQFGSTAPIPAA